MREIWEVVENLVADTCMLVTTKGLSKLLEIPPNLGVCFEYYLLISLINYLSKSCFCVCIITNFVSVILT